MLRRFFTKYARAVSDGYERRRLYKLFCAKTVAATVFYVFCAVIIAEALLLEGRMEQGTSDIPFLIFGLTLVAWLISAITALTLWIKFRRRYRAILCRPQTSGEMPEVAEYRQKTVAAQKTFWRSMWWAVLLLGFGVVFLIAMVAIETVKFPDSETFTLYGKLGVGIFTACLLVFALALIFFKTKQAARGETVELKTEHEVAAIDAAQGRKQRYSLEADNNARTFRYLFPNQDIQLFVEQLSAKQTRASLLAVMISCIAGLALDLIFFSPIVFDWGLSGFAFPVLLTVMFLCVFFTLLPFEKKLRRLEIKQKAELVAYPVYEKHLRLFRKYENFSKGKSNIFVLICAESVLISYLLALLFPHAAWSVLAVFLLIFALFYNNMSLKRLRLAAKPIEDEIDRLQKEPLKFLVSADFTDVAATYKSGALSAGNVGSAYIHLGNYLVFAMENGTKRIVGLCCDNLDGCPNAPLGLPTMFYVGGLMLDDARDFPPSYRSQAAFPEGCAYDAQSRILQLGTEGVGTWYQIFRNVFVLLSDENTPQCLRVTEIELS